MVFCSLDLCGLRGTVLYVLRIKIIIFWATQVSCAGIVYDQSFDLNITSFLVCSFMTSPCCCFTCSYRNEQGFSRHGILSRLVPRIYAVSTVRHIIQTNTALWCIFPVKWSMRLSNRNYEVILTARYLQSLPPHQRSG